MNSFEKIIKKSNIDLESEKLAYLTYENKNLVPCSLSAEGDSLIFRFYSDELYDFKIIQNNSITDKYRALINCAEFEKQRKEYSFSIKPENLMLDLNLCPKAVMRNTACKGDFAEEYKSLIASVLFPKYSFEDYYEGGKDLFKKKNLLRQIKQKESVSEIKDFLLEQYYKESERIKKEKTIVNKRNVIASRISIPIISAMLVALCIKGYFVMFEDLPYRDRVIEANSAYLAEDYQNTQKALEGIATDNLSLNSKYILARACVITESLTSEQKENVLSGITLKSDERVLAYWIDLGRLDFDSSIDFSKQIGDNELLMFALIKKNAYVKNDTSLLGEEKADITAGLEKQIEELKNLMEKQQTEIAQGEGGSVSVTDIS